MSPFHPDLVRMWRKSVCHAYRWKSTPNDWSNDERGDTLCFKSSVRRPEPCDTSSSIGSSSTTQFPSSSQPAVCLSCAISATAMRCQRPQIPVRKGRTKTIVVVFSKTRMSVICANVSWHACSLRDTHYAITTAARWEDIPLRSRKDALIDSRSNVLNGQGDGLRCFCKTQLVLWGIQQTHRVYCDTWQQAYVAAVHVNLVSILDLKV